MVASAVKVALRIDEKFSWLKELMLIGAGSLLLGLFAHFSFRLPFTPVPIVVQDYIALLLGAFLGSKRGALAVLLFIAEGSLGLPFFAQGTAGFAILAGPTGGYLLGYVLGAYLTGLFLERKKEKTFSSVFLALLLGNLAVFFLGLPWLSLYLGPAEAFLFGMVPFIPGAMIKLCASLKLLKLLKVYK